MNSIDEVQKSVLAVIRFALWGEETDARVDESVYEEMKAHVIETLAAPVLPRLDLDVKLRQAWQMSNYQRISLNTNNRHEQAALPVTMPYVILKGTEAAKYYPQPGLRVLGDIDIMPRREDFAAVCEMLLDNGYQEITSNMEEFSGRHRHFSRNGVEVEVHSRYAHQNDPEIAEWLDDLIVQHITPAHALPDLYNGLIILEHINHHLENGVGLRQIIDWMMFVHKCLPDENWPEFQRLIERLHYEVFAVTVTRMCEIYLGLQPHRWCADADQKLCGQLMDYVFSSGNFGRKQETDANASASFLAGSHTLTGAFHTLQMRGLINWKAAQNNRLLRPFAWIYQGFRYLRKGFRRRHTISKLRDEIREARNRDALFSALGVTRESEGLVLLRNGRYTRIKEGETRGKV